MIFFVAGNYCLVYWPEEDSVTAVHTDDLPEPVKVGGEWHIKRGKKTFGGKISDIGTYFCSTSWGDFRS